jgi:hypothetical protein
LSGRQSEEVYAMKLQGRELKLNVTSEDVRLLHSELALLGVNIPHAEREKALFGEVTHEAVLGFQLGRVRIAYLTRGQIGA